MIGLIRLAVDGETMIYILDILLLKDYQGMGIGAESFYRKSGFKSVSELDCVAFIKQ